MAIAALAAGASTVGAAAPGDPPFATGPLGAPVYAADAPCRNGRPEEADAPLPANAVYLDPSPIDWPTADPAAEGLDPALLEQGLAEVGWSPTVLSLLIARHGRLISESYFNGAAADQARNLHSATKSLLALVVGAAIDDGLLPGLSTPAARLVHEAAGTEVGAVTLEQLLSMSGGLAVGEEPWLVRDIVAAPLDTVPGTRWRYSDASSNLIATALERATPDGWCRYAHKVLAPLGITIDHWHLHPDSGVTGGSYAFVTPRELLRIGQLVLQGGRWEDEQVVSGDWISTMLTPRFTLAGSPYDGPGRCWGSAAHEAYGLHWRVDEVAGRTAWTAVGYGSQHLVVVPSLDLVMVLTHDTFHDALGPLLRQVAPLDVLEGFVMPALGLAAEASSCAPDLVVARADGTDAVAIAAHPANDQGGSWSPDGTRIAFHSFRDLNAELYVVDADGTDLTRLTRGWAADVAPVWSPDGTRLAFLSDLDSGWMGARPSFDIQVLDLATGSVRALTDHLGDVRALTWSPDGSRIAFIRSARPDGIGELWRVAAEGGTPERVATDPLGWPSWSPDGTRMAVIIDAPPTPTGESMIGVLDLATGTIDEIGTGLDLPSWTGDGRSIVTGTPGTTGSAMTLIDLETGARDTVPGVPGGGRPSPDGRSVVFGRAPSDVVDGADRR